MVNVYASDTILPGLENVDYQACHPWISFDEDGYAAPTVTTTTTSVGAIPLNTTIMKIRATISMFDISPTIANRHAEVLGVNGER